MERHLGITLIKLLTLELVPYVQLSIAFVIAILNHEVWAAKIRHAGNDRVAYDLPILLHDDPAVAFLTVEVEIKIVDELLGEIVPQERDVAFHLADLKHLGSTTVGFSSEPLLFVCWRIPG